MQGHEFEKKIANRLYRDGYWALLIPKNESGAQPFDLIAIKGKKHFAVDCKVVSGNANRFPLRRIEDNQWLAFNMVEGRTDCIVGLMIYHEKTNTVRFVSYSDLLYAMAEKRKSIDLRTAEVVYESFC